jgi:hypothetical protein
VPVPPHTKQRRDCGLGVGSVRDCEAAGMDASEDEDDGVGRVGRRRVATNISNESRRRRSRKIFITCRMVGGESVPRLASGRRASTSFRVASGKPTTKYSWTSPSVMNPNSRRYPEISMKRRAYACASDRERKGDPEHVPRQNSRRSAMVYVTRLSPEP